MPLFFLLVVRSPVLPSKAPSLIAHSEGRRFISVFLASRRVIGQSDDMMSCGITMSPQVTTCID